MAPEKRKHIDRMLYFQFAKGALETLLVVLCMIAIVLMGGLWVLQSHFNDLVAQLTIVTNQQTTKNTKMKEINTVLRRVEQIQAEHMSWVPRMADLAQMTPAGIVINNAQLDRNNNTYTLSGSALTRDTLLHFEQQLESLPYVEEVQVPLSQLIEKEDIRFTITAQLEETDI